MGASYRSSGSSSSYSSSSSSSYRSSSYSSSSYRSSSNSSSHNSSSTSSYTSSPPAGPEPTAYFEADKHDIHIHFKSSGQADVIESFLIKEKTAKVGIVRKKFLKIANWKISELKVTPVEYYANAFDWEIDVNWKEGANDSKIPLELSYRIEQPMETIGNSTLLFWEVEKKIIRPEKANVTITWDEDLIWKSFQVSQRYYDPNLFDYSEEPVKLILGENKITIDPSSLRNDFTHFVLLGFPESNVSSSSGNLGTADQEHYTTHQKITLNENGSDRYEVDLSFFSKETKNQEKLFFDYGINHFYSQNNSLLPRFLSPSYQIHYDYSSNMSSGFWSQIGASVSSPEIKKENSETSSYNYKFAFTALGEHFTQGNKEIIYLQPVSVKEWRNKLSSLSLEIIFPEEVDLSQTNISLFLTDCDYCGQPTAGRLIPTITQIGKDKNRVLLNWNSSLPEGYFPIVKIETDPSLFSNWFFINYAAAMRALFLSPGSGSNLEFLLSSNLIFVTILGFCFFWILPKWKKSSYYVELNPYEILKQEQNKKKLLGEILSYDPNFDLNDFFAKTKFIGNTLVESWTKGNMEPVRHYVSAGVFQRLRIQLQLLEEVDELKNLTTEFKILDQKILHVEVFSDYLTIHIKLSCKAKDVSVSTHLSDKEKNKLVSEAEEGTYEEVYSFSRRLSAKTQIGKDLIHNLCPSCGADSPFSHTTTKCQYCGSIFNSGENDWVLSEITQVVEWDTDRFMDYREFAKKHTESPSSIQILEDRASSLFWKWIYAKTKADPKYISRETTNRSLLEGVKRRELFFLPVVGSVEVSSFQNKGTSFEAVCNFRWSAARRNNLLPEHKRNNLKLVLSGTRETKLGFSEVTCKKCGGPFPETDATNCDYCKEPIPDLVNDWLLEEID